MTDTTDPANVAHYVGCPAIDEIVDGGCTCDAWEAGSATTDPTETFGQEYSVAELRSATWAETPRGEAAEQRLHDWAADLIESQAAQLADLKRMYRRRGAYIRWMRWIARKDRADALVDRLVRKWQP